MQNNLILSVIDKDELQEWLQKAIAEEMRKHSPLIEKKRDEELLTRKEVAKIFKTSLVTLRQWEKDKIIPKPIRKGSRVFFRKSDIMNDIAGKEEI